MESYAEYGNINHLDGQNLPSRAEVAQLQDDLIAILFPGYSGVAGTGSVLDRVRRDLSAQVLRGFCFGCSSDLQIPDCDRRATGATEAALMARRYGAADELVLEVSDTFCPWNAGRWRIETAGEPGAAVAEVNQTTKAADLTLDTTDLAAMYLGGVRPTELGRAGRIGERTPGALVRANTLFAAQRTPWCMTMF